MKEVKGVYQGSICIAHFFDEGHAGLADLEVMIVDETNVSNRTERDSCWA